MLPVLLAGGDGPFQCGESCDDYHFDRWVFHLDASFAQFNSNLLHWIAIVFMLVGCLPFMLFVQAWHGRSLRMFKDIQIAGLLGVVIGASAVLATDVAWTEHMTLGTRLPSQPLMSLRLSHHGLYQYRLQPVG